MYAHNITHITSTLLYTGPINVKFDKVFQALLAACSIYNTSHIPAGSSHVRTRTRATSCLLSIVSFLYCGGLGYLNNIVLTHVQCVNSR